MSRRLRGALLRHRLVQGRPEDSARVLGWVSRDAYRNALRAISKAARIRDVLPKHLRDTYASQLLVIGVPLGWILRQLAHGQLTTTARHYASWVGADGYRNPEQVQPRASCRPTSSPARLSTTPPPRHYGLESRVIAAGCGRLG